MRTTCSTVMSLPSRELPKLDWKSVAPAWRRGWFIEITKLRRVTPSASTVTSLAKRFGVFVPGYFSWVKALSLTENGW